MVDTEMADTFGSTMRRLRQDRGMSLRGLGLRVHVDQGHLGRIEAGVRRCAPDIAVAVDRVLGGGGALCETLPMVATNIEVGAGLDTVWDALRGRHPDLPPATITIISRGVDDGAAMHVYRYGPTPYGLAIGVDRLKLGGAATFRTLAHHAAHALARARGNSDVAGRYHNARFLELAVEIGLVFPGERDVVNGFATVELPDRTADEYAEQITMLDTLLATYRPVADPATRTSRKDQLKASCQCVPPRSFRIAGAVLDLGMIHCEVCDKYFVVG